MNYLNLMKKSAAKTGSIICMGMDPVLEDIPLSRGNAGERIEEFYTTILNRLVRSKNLPGAVKPNIAFYAQYGMEGLAALKNLITLYRHEDIPIILDAKRGDIGKTARAYAMECFDYFEADAVTLAPYMGYDSIEPFMTSYPDRGYYILTRTSNPGAVDFQDCLVNEKKLYNVVAEKIISWYKPGIGSVVGATYPSELEEIHTGFTRADKEIPLLIPGVGAQGGDLQTVCSILKSQGDITLHRINSSSGINFAYKKHKGLTYDAAADKELAALSEETRRFM